jgi:hypothetical protein
MKFDKKLAGSINRIPGDIHHPNCFNCSGVCCTSFKIPQLDKPVGKPCQHLTCEGVCGIQDRKKAMGLDVCTKYNCGEAGPILEKIFKDSFGFVRNTRESIKPPTKSTMRSVSDYIIGLPEEEKLRNDREECFDRIFIGLSHIMNAIRTMEEKLSLDTTSGTERLYLPEMITKYREYTEKALNAIAEELKISNGALTPKIDHISVDLRSEIPIQDVPSLKQDYLLPGAKSTS